MIPGYSYPDGPAIALPAEEHGLIPNLKGEYSRSPQDLVARDFGNLRDFTNALESSIQELLNLIGQGYPGTLGGG